MCVLLKTPPPGGVFITQYSSNKLAPPAQALECDIRMVRLIEKKLEYAKQMTVRLEVGRAGPGQARGGG